MSQATYVYGVRRTTPDNQPKTLNTTGIADAPLHEVQSGELSALISALPADEQELQLGREELSAHAKVLEEAIQIGTVLPMRFGVVMESEDAVRTRLLDAYSAELQTQLEQFEGKVELRVRAMYDEQQVMREIVAENPQIAKLRERVRGRPDDATYFDRIQLGELIVEAIENKRIHDTAQIMQRLEPLADDAQLGTPSHERMVMSASFLVDRKQIDKFDQAVDEVGREQADRMRLKYTGPLPPHSFAHLATAGQPQPQGA